MGTIRCICMMYIYIYYVCSTKDMVNSVVGLRSEVMSTVKHKTEMHLFYDEQSLAEYVIILMEYTNLQRVSQ